ncbi:MAG: 6-carboxyhexanoate--CoA ligase [Nitrospirota bacterium]
MSFWSIRMRASKSVTSNKLRVTSKKQNKKLSLVTRHSLLLPTDEIHISGAEGIYETSEIQKVIKKYTLRALDHPKGRPDRVVITIEDIMEKPEIVPSLPVTTIKCSSTDEAKDAVIKILRSLKVSERAIDVAFELIRKDRMRGAAIITSEKGNRLEPDRERGVRASRLGINKTVLRILSSKLSRLGINTETVKEALILASKVASCEHVIAELCVSDDPDYTTGYVASKKFGYLRIPGIKHKGSKSGGRAFFVKEGINVKDIIDYLERMPVIIGKVASCKGIISLNEILNRPYL